MKEIEVQKKLNKKRRRRKFSEGKRKKMQKTNARVDFSSFF